MAHLHCAPTDTAADALRRENVDPATIHVTGNTVIDALHWVTARIRERPEIAGGLAEWETRFAGRRIIGVTSHRRENFGEGMQAIAGAIRRIAARDDVALIFPVHLNPHVRQVMQAELAGLDNVALIEPLDYPHFARLLDIATLMLTDSGGVQEEAPALGKPVLVMRETTERPKASRRAPRGWSAPMRRGSSLKPAACSMMRMLMPRWRGRTIRSAMGQAPSA